MAVSYSHSNGTHATGSSEDETSALSFQRDRYGGDPEPGTSRQENGLYNTTVRHGFEQISEKWMLFLASEFRNYYEDKRHETGGIPSSLPQTSSDWRITDRQRTVNAALVLCLNLGVDPPDIIKTKPCAKLEAWVNPSQIPDSRKAIEQIGKNLQAQYETLSTRTKYKQCLDPNVDDAKRFCMGFRRSAREERILFHYNGHGVPKPTQSGEIWVFNRGYTQYIPVSLYELQNWLGAPVIYCWDCSGAGMIVQKFLDFVEKRKTDESTTPLAEGAVSAASLEGCIQMAACRADEILPMNPKLPADMFTCCITTPVEIAVKWFVLQEGVEGLDAATVSIPGKISDRRTPLGELNWIFTAITDTIAWSALEQPLFKRLFRQDLVVAAMFRNFLLAVRILRTQNCHPVSSPELPDTHNHPLWASWDLALNKCLLQLPEMRKAEEEGRVYAYDHSNFFEQQLTAFEVWLKYKSSDIDSPPEQLPILLQVLLSQIHRLRALLLLSKYLDLGPKAVKIALNIGFFIYVLKLLQSPAPELKPVLVFIWTRIMAVDYQDIQHELTKDNGYTYFVSILLSPSTLRPETFEGSNVLELLAMCCFVISQFCRGYKPAQKLCATPELIEALTNNLAESESPLLRHWSALCLGRIWENFEDAKILVRSQENQYTLRVLRSLLVDPIPEVSAAVVWALSTFLDKHDEDIVKAIVANSIHASPLVRSEVITFYAKLLQLDISKFLVCAFTTLEEEFQLSRTGDLRSESPAHHSTWLAAWRVLLSLTVDPHDEVKLKAQILVDHVYEVLLSSPLGEDSSLIFEVLEKQTDKNDSDEPSKAQTQLHNQTNNFDNRNNSAGNTNGGATNGDKYNKDFESAFLSLKGAKKFSLQPGAASRNLQASRSMSAPQSRLQRSESFDSVASRTSFTEQIVDGVFTFAKNWWSGKPSDQNASSSLRSSDNSIAPGSSSSRLPSIGNPSGTTSGPTVEDIRCPPVTGSSSSQYSYFIDRESVLAAKSSFYDWCAEYFTEPQKLTNLADEPGSQKQLEGLWRKSRNERILAETQVQKDMAVTSSWSNPMQVLKIGAPAELLHFAQFEPQLIATSKHNIVDVWDWSEGRRLNKFSNGNAKGTSIMSTHLLNEDSQSLLLTTSNDGMARVYRKFESSTETELTTAWWLFQDILPQHSMAPLKSEWQQSRGSLLVGGDTRVIRVWDAGSELAVEDIPAGTFSRLTSLTSDQVSGNICVAGFFDGSVHVFDRRLDKNSMLVQRWRSKRQTRSSVINVRMQRGGARELVTGASDGTVELWDIRMTDPILSFVAHTREMRALDVHEHAPVIATASRIAGLWSTNGRRVSTVRSPSATNANSVHEISALKFHPHRMMLAMGCSGEAQVTVFECMH